MARAAVVCLFPCVLFFGFSSQDTSPSRQLDAGAVKTVQLAVSALGGATVFSSIADAVSTGEIRTSVEDSTESLTFKWETSGTQFRYETKTSTGSSQIFASGHGNPANFENGAVQKLPQPVALAAPAFHLPGLLLWSRLQDAGFSATSLGSSVLPDGRTAVRVRFEAIKQDEVITNATRQDWYIDQANSQPIKVEYCLPASAEPSNCGAAVVEYSDYRAVGKSLEPFVLKFSLPGGSVSLVKVDSVALNVGLDSAQFDLVPGAAQ